MNIAAALRAACKVSPRPELDTLILSRQHIENFGGLSAISAAGISFVHIVLDSDYSVVVEKVDLRKVLK